MKRFGTGKRKMLVLEAIPYDDWISAREIAAKIGITPQAVGIIINKSLSPVYVEKKKADVKKPRTFIYKRRSVFLEIKKPRD